MSVMKIITEREGREHCTPINCKPQVFDILKKRPSKIQYPFFSIPNANHCEFIGKEGFESLKDAFSFLSMELVDLSKVIALLVGKNVLSTAVLL